MAKKKRVTKHAIKARAGRKGSQVRWMRMLAWLRLLVKLRRGTFTRPGIDNPITEHWRVNLIGVQLMLIALWRTTGRKKRARKEGPWEYLKLRLPDAAIAELEKLNHACDTGLSLESIQRLVFYCDSDAGFISYGPRNWPRNIPWAHAHWRHESLEWALKVTIDEQEQLAALRPRRKLWNCPVVR